MNLNSFIIKQYSLFLLVIMGGYKSVLNHLGDLSKMIINYFSNYLNDNDNSSSCDLKKPNYIARKCIKWTICSTNRSVYLNQFLNSHIEESKSKMKLFAIFAVVISIFGILVMAQPQGPPPNGPPPNGPPPHGPPPHGSPPQGPPPGFNSTAPTTPAASGWAWNH